MLDKTKGNEDLVALFLLPHPGIESSRPRVLGVQKCRRLQNYSVFFATCNLLHLAHFCGSQEKGDWVCFGKQNCRRSQTLCFYCYFRSSATCATFRFAEPRQSSNELYIKKPSVSWDRGGLQGIFAEDALHRVPPSNKYIIDLEGARTKKKET